MYVVLLLSYFLGIIQEWSEEWRVPFEAHNISPDVSRRDPQQGGMLGQDRNVEQYLDVGGDENDLGQ